MAEGDAKLEIRSAESPPAVTPKTGEPLVKDGSTPMVPMSELWHFADFLDWFLMFLGSVAGIATGVAMPLFMLIFGQILDELGKGSGSLEESINKLALAMTILGLCSFAMSTMQVFFFGVSSARQTEKLRNALLTAILRQEIGWFDTNNGGELATVLSEAAVAFQEGTGRRIADGFQAAAQFLAGLVIAFIKSWQLSLVLLAGIPVIGGATALLTKVLADAKSKSAEQYAAAGGVAGESLSAIRTVASLCAERKFMELYNGYLKDAERIGIAKSSMVGFANGALFSSAFFIYALAFYYGSRLVADDIDCNLMGHSGCITGGAVVTTFFAFLIGCFSLGQLAPTLKALATARGSMVRVMQIIKRQPELDSLSTAGKKLDHVVGDIEFDVEEFAYPARPQNRVCNGYKLSVKAGETVALVGPSGGGKSTAISLLLRFYDPIVGSIKLDGHDLKDLNLEWLRNQIGYVGQEPVLFSGSIGDNIRSGAPHATDAEVTAAAKAANAHDFILKFHDAYATDVGQKGGQMSGGQKQRIAIARAIIRNPSILLLDEATSALDNESEKEVQAALDDLQKQKRRTTFVIAHRLSTIRNADKIAVIEKGRVKELGTHDELMAIDKGIYAELVALQGGMKSPVTSSDNLAELGDVEAGKTVFGQQRRLSMSRKLSSVTDGGKSTHSHAATGAGGHAEAGGKAADNEPQRPSTWSLALKHWPYLFVGLLANALLGVLFPLWGYFLANIFNIFYSFDPAYVRTKGEFWSGMFVLLGVGSITFYTLSFWGLGNVAERLTFWLRQQCYEAIMRRNVGWFDMPENNVGALTTRLETETQQIHKLTGDMLGRQFQALATLSLGVIISFTSSWEIALVTLATFPLNAAANAVQMQVALGQGTDQAGITGGAEASGLLNAAISSIRTVSAFNMQNHIQTLYKKAIAPLSKDRKVRGLVQGVIFGTTNLLLYATYGLLFWFGGKLVSKGTYTFQEMMQAIMSILMGAMGLGQALGDLVDMKEAQRDTDRVLDLLYSTKDLSIDSLAPTGKKLSSVKGALEFKNIHFRYPARPQQWVLGGPDHPEGFSLKIEAGQTVAFVGQSGSGKSTLIAFTLRFYDPEEGMVLLDNLDLKAINVHSLRGSIAYVGQEPTLFKGTVAENIAYGLPSASIDQIKAAAKAANAHSFIEEFTNGYQTELAEGSINLSGGQKQRIALARAIIKDAPILLLDEATSALDNESERLVQEALDRLQQIKKRTTLIVAHRLSTVRHADKIVVMRNGTIVEAGNHDSLIAQGGTYATLAAQQGLL